MRHVSAGEIDSRVFRIHLAYSFSSEELDAGFTSRMRARDEEEPLPRGGFELETNQAPLPIGVFFILEVL